MSELPDTSEQEAIRWLDQAREDLAAAQVIDASEGVPARLACFLAHLAGEKAIKACLIHSGRDPRRTHDLLKLRTALSDDVASRFQSDDLASLNPWTIEGRYPDDLDAAAEADAGACIEAAERVIQAARSVIHA